MPGCSWGCVVVKSRPESCGRRPIGTPSLLDSVTNHLRRHDLRHTGLTWFADAGVPLHRLQQIAGHTDPRITQRCLHPEIQALQNDGEFLSASSAGPQLPVLEAEHSQEHWSPNGPHLRIVK
ncbi:site-specific integrase [Nocardia sp. NPDC051832]|uniref:site-specific integrase n=1 Tax=Nocardia sp. NPDC051832 TaxID=3155673 RepID=UPI0034464185